VRIDNLNAITSPPTALCDNAGSTTINGTVNGVTWGVSGLSGTTLTPIGAGQNATLASYNVTGNTANATVTVTATNGVCPQQSVNIQIDNNPENVDAGPNQALCNTSNFTMAATPNPVAYGTPDWSCTNNCAGVSFSSSTSPTTIVSGISNNTTTTLQWRIVNGACTVTDAVTVRNDQQNVISGNTTICDMPAATTYNYTSTPASSVWSVSSGGGTISSGGVYNPSDVAAPAGSMAVVITAQNGSCSANYNVTVYNEPNISSPSGSSVCQGQTIPLTADVTSGISWAVVQGPNCGSCIVGNDFVAPDPGSTSALYGIEATTGPGCTKSVYFNVDKGLVLTPSGATLPVCDNSALVLSASPSAKFTITGSGSFNNIVTQTSISGSSVVFYPANVATPTQSTTTSLEITSTNGACVYNKTIRTDNDNSIVTAPSPICQTGTSNLTGNVNGVIWTASTGSITSPGLNATLSGVTGPQTVTVTATNGSCTPKTANIVIDQPLSSPAVISANTTVFNGENAICGDGANDLTLSVTNYGGSTTYAWSGPNSWSGPSNYSVTRNNVLDGTTQADGTYSVEISNSCNSNVTGSIAVNVHKPIQAISSVSATEPVTGDYSICEGGDIQLNVNITDGTDYIISWTGSNGFTSSVEDPLVDGNLYTLNSGGNFVSYNVSVSNVCPNSPFTDITNDVWVDDFITANPDINTYKNSDVNPYPEAGDYDYDHQVIQACGSLSVGLLANNPAPATGVWTLGPGSAGSVTSWGTSNTSAAITPTVDVYGSYVFEWTVTSGTGKCVDMDFVRVVFNEPITLDVELAGCSFVSPTASDLIKVTANTSGVNPVFNISDKPVTDNLLVDVSTGGNNITHVYTAPFNTGVHEYRVTDEVCIEAASVTVRSGQPADLSTPSVPATPNTATCIDKNFNSWMTFLDDNNQAIAAINDNGNGLDLGEVTVKVWQEASEPLITQLSGQGNCGGYTNAAMKRHFQINSTNYPSGTPLGQSVSVRLFFTDQDLQDLITASTTGDDDPASESCSHNDDISNISELYVTKYSGINEDGDYTNNSPGGIYKVYGDPTPYNTQPDGPLTEQSNGFSSTYGAASGLHSVELNVDELSEFWLHGSGSGTPLPVEMLYIEANAIDNSYIQVRWATALEIDNNGFQVERSTDGQSWSAIGWVDGHNNTTVQQNYSYDDHTVTAGIRYYYRLKQIDNDGDYEYTGIVSAIITNGITFSVKDFIPNPATNSTTLIITASNEQPIEVDIFNAIGQRVMSEPHTLNKGANQLPFNITNLAAGSYTAVVSSNNEVYSKKLVVVK
jgi:hypothetical protein